ncbi:hypothetical protein H4684_003303 [Desulfomicrobium macestii]|uniref:Cas10/Cmr2 second palm domain-containing protein n=1 Tax=Desulfomicrobium macestii TaxID=90731 RepID=A0ABR9H7E4_9BACT|nr:hypothetical protein [Desulfomicrobium macestii]MBE1426637.1 hypothetical protein [Desulfomicrobium macestii]
MQRYLCYDVKGIQSFIFKIPKLKYIIGGSALIDRFDKITMPGFHNANTQLIFAGGGKGTFLCKDEQILNDLKSKIIAKAHGIGLDIRFGENEDFSQASQHADEIFSFVPVMNNGRPCPISGLYPVSDDRPHPVLNKRLYERGEKIYRHFENKLLKDILLPGIPNENLEFFHNVDDDDGLDGLAGAKALGNRNRWAIISMDGNDMGMQFRHQVSKDNPKRLSTQELQRWIREMSYALDLCTCKAATAAIQRVVSEWADSDQGKETVKTGKDVVLPVRPLLVGGDDIVVLCHCSYAMTFVKEAMRIFELTSAESPHLWPATNGRLTITAGVLYAPVSLPLHTAIPYSETLLASAKTRGRKKGIKNEASPACIDWEQITDTLVDSPAAKRQRELLFEDEELDRIVKLTCRPCTMDEYHDIESVARKYERVPTTVRHKILPALSKPYAERLAFYAECKKNHGDTIFKDLKEFDARKPGNSWFLSPDKKEQSTNIIDALMLLEEEGRMQKETV